MDRLQCYSESSDSDKDEVGGDKVMLVKSQSKTIFTRQKPHIQGNWPCHIYISFDFHDGVSNQDVNVCLLEQIQAFQRHISLRMESRRDDHTLILVPHVNINIHQRNIEDESVDSSATSSSDEGNDNSVPSQQLHMSLSKPFYLQKQSIPSFLKDLKHRIQSFHNTLILHLVKKTEILSNEDCSRSFLTLPVVPSVSTDANAIHHVVTLVDGVLEKYGASPYYSNAKFHVSIASWTYDSWIIENCQEYLAQDQQVDTKHELFDLNLVVRGIYCDIGTVEKHYIPFE